jgi:hypothetical protein
MRKAYKLWQKSHSIYRASKETGVPKNTLRDRVAGLVKPQCQNSGKAPLFSKNEETELVNHIIECASYGFGYNIKIT